MSEVVGPEQRVEAAHRPDHGQASHEAKAPDFHGDALRPARKMAPRHVLHLQRLAGNAAASQLLSRSKPVPTGPAPAGALTGAAAAVGGEAAVDIGAASGRPDGTPILAGGAAGGDGDGSEAKANRLGNGPSIQRAPPTGQPAPAVSVTGVTLTASKVTIPTSTTLKATAQPANATDVTYTVEKDTVDPTSVTIDPKTGVMGIAAGQQGGRINVKATASDGSWATAPQQIIEKPTGIVSTTGSGSDNYGGQFVHTFSAPSGKSSGLEGGNINEKFASLTSPTPWGADFTLTANAAGSPGWDLDSGGQMVAPDNVSISSTGVDVGPFVKSASNPNPKGALPQGFTMTQNLHAKSLPAKTLDGSAFTSVPHKRTLVPGPKFEVEAGAGKVSEDYSGPAAVTGATASPNTVMASPPKPKTGTWNRTKVQVTANSIPTTGTKAYSITGNALGCAVDANGEVSIGSAAGSITVRVTTSKKNWDEVTITITEFKAPPAANPTPQNIEPADPGAIPAVEGSVPQTSEGGGGGARPRPVVQRITLDDGPPLAPGNYRYGATIVSLNPAAMRSTLTDMAARDGLAAERKWQEAFVADMRAQGAKHSYEDPDAKQSVQVEPTMATRAEDAQAQVDNQAAAVQTQFQQTLLNSVRDLLASSEQKLQAEGRRYGFPDDESIFRPKPLSAGAAAISPSMPGFDDLRGMMTGAKELLDGKKKLKKARDTVAASGPILGDAMRPTVLEPAVKEYHTLRQKLCTQYPLLSSIERNDDRLGEMASGAAHAGKGSTGPAATAALVNAKEEVRKDLADKLSNISYIRAGMNEPDKIGKFWLDPGMRENTKRSMGIAPSTLQNAAIQDKVDRLQDDADFDAKLKQALGVALLIASFVPGVAPVAGAVGLIVAAADVTAAFQQFYWEEAAAGTAMEKAEAISQTDPSLFGLAVSIALGMLEGLAEAKALEGAIGVFKVVGAAYREARAAGVAAQLGSGTARAGAAAELVSATERLKTTADQASGKPGLGDKIVASLPADVKSTAKSLDRSLKLIKDPGLKELVLRGDKAVTPAGETLMDLAIKDPHELIGDFAEWRKSKSGKPFEDWLGKMKEMPEPGVLNEPAGLLEYGLKEGEARRSFDACVREDSTREAGIWRDPETGEHVCAQGGPGFVDHDWMIDVENHRGGKVPKWELVIHHHPNRGIPIDRLPSPGDFGHITRYQRAGDEVKPVTSSITWTDPESKISFQSEFGFTPGAERPYWTRYRVEDGTFKIASFKDRPGTSGEYQDFVNKFTGKPTDVVPGGNVAPVALPPPPPTVREGPKP